MHPVRHMSFFSLAGVIVAASALQCSRPSDMVLECSAPDIRHVLRVRAIEHRVEDLSVVPAKQGEAEVTDSEYHLRFQEQRDRYELLFRINRSTGRGTRELFDDEQQAIRGHGGYDEIVCEPYRGSL